MRYVRIAPQARRDIANLLFSMARWVRLGDDGTHLQQIVDVDRRTRYRHIIGMAIQDVAADPDRPASHVQPELGSGIRSYRFSISTHPVVQDSTMSYSETQHLLVYRLPDDDHIEILLLRNDPMRLRPKTPPAVYLLPEERK